MLPTTGVCVLVHPARLMAGQGAFNRIFQVD